MANRSTVGHHVQSRCSGGLRYFSVSQTLYRSNPHLRKTRKLHTEALDWRTVGYQRKTTRHARERRDLIGCLSKTTSKAGSPGEAVGISEWKFVLPDGSEEPGIIWWRQRQRQEQDSNLRLDLAGCVSSPGDSEPGDSRDKSVPTCEESLLTPDLCR